MCASERSDLGMDWPELIRRRLAARTRRVLDDGGQRRAAVLVPLLQDRGELCVLFTRRTETVEHHKGQISLPGGARDPGDAGLLETALRETEEELGLRRDLVTILGTLDDVATVVSGFVITPFVGVIPHPVPLRVNPHEIAEVLTVPLAVFRDPARMRVETRAGPFGERVEVVFYDHGPLVIWGATARIMKEFIEAAFGEKGS